MVADIALAHGAADVKGHGRDHFPGRLPCQDDAAHLGAVSVDDGHFIAPQGDIGKVGAGLLDHAELALGGGVAVLALQGVASQGNDEFFVHRRSPFPFWGVCPENGTSRQYKKGPLV